MSVQLIALDIAGTLLSSRFTVPERNRPAIAEATRRGIEVALVTGRRYDFAMPVAKQIDSPLTMIVNKGEGGRSKEGETLGRERLPRNTALRVLQATQAWRDAASVVFDRPLANQVMMETIDLEDGIRGAYYKWNRPFLGEAKPLETCLSEDPIQVMFSGSVQPMRAAEQALRSVQFTDEFALPATAYEGKVCSMLDVITPPASTRLDSADWTAF